VSQVLEVAVTAGGMYDLIRELEIRIRRAAGKVETHRIHVDASQEGTTYLATLYPGDQLIYCKPYDHEKANFDISIGGPDDLRR